MIRTFLGCALGAILGLLAITIFGAWGGYTYGGEWVNQPALTAGWETALRGALIATVYFGWFGFVVGAFIGGCAGFASWVVRPRPKPAWKRALVNAR